MGAAGPAAPAPPRRSTTSGAPASAAAPAPGNGAEILVKPSKGRGTLWEDVAGNTPSWKVPVAIEIRRGDHEEEDPNDCGIFYHSPRSFNHDVYVKKGKSDWGDNDLYFYCKSSSNLGSWRTGQATFADPLKLALGAGSQYPAGLNSMKYGEHYRDWAGKNDWGDHWTMTFHWTDPAGEQAAVVGGRRETSDADSGSGESTAPTGGR